MDKTNPMFAKFDQVLGNANPTSSSGTPSRSDQILTMERDNAPQPSLGDKISSDINTRGANMNTDLNSTEGNAQNNPSGFKDTFAAPFIQGTADLSHGIQAAGQGAGAITDVAGDVGSALLNHLGIKLQPNVKPIVPENPVINGIKNTVAKTASQAYNELGIRLNDFVNQHPELGKVLTNILGAGQGAGNVANAALIGEGVVSGAQAGVDAAKTGISAVQDTAANLKNAVSDKFASTEPNDLQKIQETISPKPTVSQAKIAETQGRLYKGSEPTLLNSGGEDKIAASTQTANSARTIEKNIPGAASMDEPTLHQALTEKIGQTAQELKPVMEATPVQSETVQKISDDLKVVQESQKADAYIPDNVNVQKLQSDFEERLKGISEDSNMNDVWETRQAYDDSVPDRVKQASDLSSDTLRAQKDIWLQNRKILTDAINDTENGLGAQSKQAFSDMRDMYEAKSGILSKAKISTTVQPSKIGQFFKKTTTGKVIKHVAKAAAGAAIGKGLAGTGGEIAGGIMGSL